MEHQPEDKAEQERRRRAAHDALTREETAHWAQAAAFLAVADAALGRVARFDDEDQAVVTDAWTEAHGAEVQAAEHTADAGAVRADAANLYSPNAPGGPTTVRAAAPRPRAGARPASARLQARSRR